MNEKQEPQHNQSADNVDAPMAERSAKGETPAPVDWAVLLSVLALLAIVAWFVYGRAIHAPFIFDDRISVVQNGSIVKLYPLLGEAGRGGPLTPLKDTVTAGRPVVNLSLAINYYFGRLDPTGYHVVNMAIHVLSAFLLWAIVSRALRLPCFDGRFEKSAGLLACLVALVWELHPLQTEAVEYVSQRTELMVACFYLATLLGSLRYWTAQSPAARTAWLVAASGACALGMACKEVMVTAPVIVLLFDRAFVSGSFRSALQRSWPLYVGLCLGWLVLLGLNISAPRSASAGFSAGVSAPDWWLTQCQVLLMYLKLAVWPWPLVIHYEVPYHHSLATAWPWAAPTALLLLGALVLLWQNRAAGFLLARALLILSPTLVVPIPSEIAAERRMYLSLAALVTLAVVGGFWLIDRWLGSRGATFAGATSAKYATRITVLSAVTISLLFGLVSIRRLAAYSDLLTLWQDAALHQPNNVVVLVSLGASYTGAGKFDDAIQTLRRALELCDDSAALGIHKQLGTAYHSAGRPQEAIEALQTALRVDPAAPGVEHVLGIALINSSRSQEAIEHLQRAIEQQPDEPEIHANLGAALLNTDRQGEAISSFERALQLKPNFLGAQSNLAIAYAKTDRPKLAIAAAERAQLMARELGTPEATAQLDAWLRTYKQEHPSP